MQIVSDITDYLRLIDDQVSQLDVTMSYLIFRECATSNYSSLYSY